MVKEYLNARAEEVQTLFLSCFRSAKYNAKTAICAKAIQMQTSPFRQLLSDPVVFLSRIFVIVCDHFIEIINRPYFCQDVSLRSILLKLDSGETIDMPNVVRTVTRSTMIRERESHCKSLTLDRKSVVHFTKYFRFVISKNITTCFNFKDMFRCCQHHLHLHNV